MSWIKILLLTKPQFAIFAGGWICTSIPEKSKHLKMYVCMCVRESAASRKSRTGYRYELCTGRQYHIVPASLKNMLCTGDPKKHDFVSVVEDRIFFVPASEKNYFLLYWRSKHKKVGCRYVNHTGTPGFPYWHMRFFHTG